MPVAVPNREEIQRRIADGSNVWIAAGDGDIERVRFLMEHDGAKPTSADSAKYTPLHAAASYARIDMLRFLLKDEPAESVNVGDMDDETPLFFCEDLPAARVLIEEFHADAMRKNTEGLTASEKADVNEFPELAAYIRSYTGEQPTPRAELLARIGETDEAQPWEVQQGESGEDDGDDGSDAALDERVDGMVDTVDEIMRHAEETGTDPTEQLREVVGAHVVQQILEGYNKQL